MINIAFVEKYCKEYNQIENYEEAINDNTQMWVCHHILGETLTTDQLIAHEFYYDVPPCMLKFVTRAEHCRIHNKGKAKSEEHRRKIAKANTGKACNIQTRRHLSEVNKGRHLSEETKIKIAKANTGKHKGIPLSIEHRRKLSESLKGRHWRLVNGKREWYN